MGTPVRKPESMQLDGNLHQFLIISSPHGTPVVQELKKWQGRLGEGGVDGNLAAAPQTQRQVTHQHSIRVMGRIQAPSPAGSDIKTTRLLSCLPSESHTEHLYH